MSGTFSYGNMKSWDAEGRQFQFNAARPKNLLDIALNVGRRKIRPKMHFTHVCRMVQTLTTAKTQHGGIAI